MPNQSSPKNRKTTNNALISLLVVIAGALTAWLLLTPEAADGTKSFTVVVVHKDGSAKTVHYTTDAPFLGDYLVEQGLVEIGDADEGMFHYVDDESAIYEVDVAYWAFYIGGEYATTGLFTTPIADGVTYELRWEDASGW